MEARDVTKLCRGGLDVKAYSAMKEQPEFRSLPAEYRSDVHKFMSYQKTQQDIEDLDGLLKPNPYWKGSSTKLKHIKIGKLLKCLRLKFLDILNGKLDKFPAVCCNLAIFKKLKVCQNKKKDPDDDPEPSVVPTLSPRPSPSPSESTEPINVQPASQALHRPSSSPAPKTKASSTARPTRAHSSNQKAHNPSKVPDKVKSTAKPVKNNDIKDTEES